MSKTNKLECDPCPYRGLTYLGWLLCHKPILWLWKKFLCPHDIHLFDEWHSPSCELVPPEYRKYDHSLNCDACDLMVAIGGICEYPEWEKAFHEYNKENSCQSN